MNAKPEAGPEAGKDAWDLTVSKICWSSDTGRYGDYSPKYCSMLTCTITREFHQRSRALDGPPFSEPVLVGCYGRDAPDGGGLLRQS
jgi:hypothetical protein